MAKLQGSELRRLVDEQCDAFEQAWARGEQPALTDFLNAISAEGRPKLLAELLALELELRARAGECPEPSDYQNLFSTYAGIIVRTFEDFRSWLRSSDAIDEEVKSQFIPGDEDTERPALETRPWTPGTTPSTPGTLPALPSDVDIPRRIGRYEVLRKLGQGGMGTVLLAHDPALDRDIALKLPHFDLRDSGEAIERFYREARAMATVHHPNLCPIYDVGEHDGQPYITMAYIDGQTLAEGIAMDGPMDPRQAVQLVRKLALAIQAAHEGGVLHRDLKPSNVMIDRKGEPFITDFGLASRDCQTEAELTNSGTVIGSPAYMAPEQVSASREAIGPHTDVYAIGVILYQLLCGRRPYEGSGLAVLGEIASGRLPTPPSKLANIDKQLEAACLKAMAPSIDDRFQSAAEFSAVLERWRSDFDRGRETRRYRNRSPSALAWGGKPALVVAVAIVLLLSGGLAALFIPPADRPLPDGLVATASHSPLVLKIDLGPSSGDVQPGFTWMSAAGGNVDGVEVRFVGDQIEERDRGDVNSGDGLGDLGEDLLFLVRVIVLKNVPAGTYTFTGYHHESKFPRGDMSVTCSSDGGTSFNRGYQVDVTEGDDLPALATGSFMMTADPRSDIHIKLEGEYGTINGFTLIDAKATAENATSSVVPNIAALTSVWAEPENLGTPLNSPNIDGSPTFSGDGRVVVFHCPHPERGGYQLWTASRYAEDSLFGTPQMLGAAVNDASTTANPHLTVDGLTLVFASDRPGGVGGEDLWFSERDSLEATWSTAHHLGPHVNSDQWDSTPWLSEDRLTLAFASKRPGGFGDNDIWLATRDSVDDVFGEPVNAGIQVNTTASEACPWLSPDGLTLLFSAIRNGGYGGYDLCFSTRASSLDEFGPPANLGLPVNSAGDEGHGSLSPDGSVLYFESDRPGGHGWNDIWMSRRLPVVAPDGSNAMPTTVHFVDSGQEFEPDNSTAIAAGDLDGDGDVDVIVTRDDAPNRVWFNLDMDERVASP